MCQKMKFKPGRRQFHEALKVDISSKKPSRAVNVILFLARSTNRNTHLAVDEQKALRSNVDSLPVLTDLWKLPCI